MRSNEGREGKRQGKSRDKREWKLKNSVREKGIKY